MKNMIPITIAAVTAISAATATNLDAQNCLGVGCNTITNHKPKSKRKNKKRKLTTVSSNKRNDDYEKNTFYGILNGDFGSFDSNTEYPRSFANLNGGLLIKPSAYTSIDLNLELESGFENATYVNPQLLLKALVGLGNKNKIQVGVESNAFTSDEQVKGVSQLSLYSNKFGEWFNLEGKLGMDLEHDIQANLTLSPRFPVADKVYVVPELRAYFASNPLSEAYKSRTGASLTAGVGFGNFLFFAGANYEVKDESVLKHDFSADGFNLLAGIEIKLGNKDYVQRSSCPGLRANNKRY